MFPFRDTGIFARNWGWFFSIPFPKLIFWMGMAPWRRLGIVMMFPAAPALFVAAIICWPLGEDTIWNCCPGAAAAGTVESCWACANCSGWPSTVWNWGITWYWILGITPDMVVRTCCPGIDGAWATTYCCGWCCCPWVLPTAIDGDSSCLFFPASPPAITTEESVVMVFVPEDAWIFKGITCQPLAVEVKAPWFSSSCCCWFCWSEGESLSPGVSIRLQVAASKARGDGCCESWKRGNLHYRIKLQLNAEKWQQIILCDMFYSCCTAVVVLRLFYIIMSQSGAGPAGSGVGEYGRGHIFF